MKRISDLNKSIKMVRVELPKPVVTTNRLKRTKKVSGAKVSSGNSQPPLSTFLNAYNHILSGIKSSSEKKSLHQIELNDFEIEVNTGIAGYQNNELNLNL